MESCVQCGHDVAGRFCTHCGHPVADEATAATAATAAETVVPPDPRTDTAERPAIRVPQAPPAPAFETPPPARFPLYADEPAPPPNAVDLQTPAWLVEAEAATPVPARRRRRRPVLPWVAGAVVILLLAGVGAYLLVGDRGGGDDTAGDPAPVATGPSDDPAPRHPHSSSPAPTSSAPPSSTPPTSGDDETDVVRRAKVSAPTSARPGLDVHGNVVPYGARNMTDGVASTCWRMVGDGSGSVITIVLRQRTTMTSVGLINGYAKQDPGYDGYAANRRITKVVWSFDGGHAITQTLDEVRTMQSIQVPEVSAQTIQLQIVHTTKPGQGKTGRNYTAISDLSLIGSEQ